MWYLVGFFGGYGLAKLLGVEGNSTHAFIALIVLLCLIYIPQMLSQKKAGLDEQE
jgi:hypothetical protein